VYNAVDGCKRLGIGGSAMDAKWASAKKERAAASALPPPPAAGLASGAREWSHRMRVAAPPPPCTLARRLEGVSPPPLQEGALVKFGGGFYAGKIGADSASPASWATPLLLSLYALLGGLTK